MKRTTAFVVLFLACAISVSAEGDAGRTMPWSAPIPDIEEGSTLITVGFWADVIGIGLITGGGAAYSISSGVANTLIGLGLTSMLFVGNPCLQIGLSKHHAAAEERGFVVSGVNRDKSRTLHYIALGCGGGSLLLGIASIATGSLGLAIASNVVGFGGAVVEIVNFYIFRRNWGLELKAAAGIEVP